MLFSKILPKKLRYGIKQFLMKRWKLEPVSKSPVQARVAYKIWNFSAEDDPGKPDDFLIDTSIEVFKIAKEIKMNSITERFPNGQIGGLYPDLWPGDHYRLLAAFVKYLQPKIIIEIGTSLGTSSLALKEFLPEGSKIYTYDIVPLKDMSPYIMKEKDFSTGKITQIIGDLSDNQFYLSQIDIFNKADLIFIDAVKDVITEKKFIENFLSTEFENSPLMIWDDIKAIPQVWRNISKPKLDITSFGHFTGTGIVHWTNN